MGVGHQNLANAIRALSMDAVQAANSGHPGMPMGMADVATILFQKFLKFDPSSPKWHDRDRFVLSAGHGSMLAYSTLYLTGYANPTIKEIADFRQLTSPCAGHPENFELEGVETTTGPLGQGLATAVGMALAERHLNARFGDDLVDHRTWVIAGDGCLMEGINHEAIGLAASLKLGKLNVLWDDNAITIDGPVSLSSVEDVKARYIATGWHVVSCDGHDAADIERAMAEAVADPRPSLIACKTIIGYGSPNKQGTSATHGSPLGGDEINEVRKTLNWPHEPFIVPEDILSEWRTFGARGVDAHQQWAGRLSSHENGSFFQAAMNGDLPDLTQFDAYKAKLVADMPNVATRKSSEMALGSLTSIIDEMVGGSADLTGSNNTKTANTGPLNAENYAGRHISYGIREFGMAAAMNGMALHGGIIPYGGTFLVFADYCRAAIRLSALQNQRVIYVMTHDSIGLGEDGPTHQPIEHLQSLRAMPNLLVFRPADAVETAECWELAVKSSTTPSLLALTRQNLPAFRTDISENLCAKGAYPVVSAKNNRKLVIVATGSEVEIAMNTAKLIEEQGVGVDVVSMPCTQLFDMQDAAYQAEILPEDMLIVSIEAGTTFGWERYTGRHGMRFGIDRFGASAPIDDLYDYFGLTAEKISEKILNHLK
ncbi:transketolase [Sphingorhabdus lutea]|uniref:Transketolase n=1 Tax=Sphingorhabdus lutea TaxID=1913578 RepID=A0A1L3JBS6_9SPHN|nr:transketolase [Sphingorhabdus lutea]APG62580.1 transketolase [Sphingorhabdus lutea]